MKNINSAPCFLQILFLAIAATILMSSCNTTTILSANFNNDDLGREPMRDIPGDPTGDMIIYRPEVASTVRIVATTGTAKGLRFSEGPLPWDLSGHLSALSFKCVSTNFAKPITFTWVATPNGGRMPRIDFSDGSNLLASLKVNGGRLLAITSIDGSSSIDIGPLPDSEKHNFFVSVNLQRNSYSVSVVGNPHGTFNLRREGLPLLIAPLEVRNPAEPTLSFNFHEYGSTGSSSVYYTFDSIVILKGN